MRGKRILLTGATGFLGRALLERLVVDVPVGRVDVVARGDAAGRVSAMLDDAVFSTAVSRLGRARVAELFSRVRPVACDLAAEAPEVADDVDVVIHTAAAVSFDPPIDEAFAANLEASLALLRAAKGRRFVHVSTAYVAGSTRGVQREEPLDRGVDWRAEARAAARAREEVESASRAPEVLEELLAKARRERGRVGPQATAARAEELRRTWVRDRLVERGRSRARTLGWPDVYTFTKALAEIALDEEAGDSPLVIVRPSIIESALTHPHPGWIEGFRMADPLILAYGRGALPEFTGHPEHVVDIVPVDHVVNCILAVAASPPARRAVFHVSSGARSPLRYRELYELTRAYFLSEPLAERNRGHHAVPRWRFPGSDAVAARLSRAERALGLAERAVSLLPRGPGAREAARRVDRIRRRVDFARRYATLYGPYSEIEAIYTDDAARALYESLPEPERAEFPFAVPIDWRHYLQEVHLPAITLPVRWMSGGVRPRPQVRLESGPADRVLAVFDVEGTVVASNVVEPYLWLRLAELETPGRARALASLAARLPGLVRRERRDRGEFLRHFYRLYEGADAARLEELAAQVLPELVLRRVLAGAVRRLRAHRAAGHRVVLVSASLELVVRVLAPLADEVVGARLQARSGRVTGDLEGPPLVGEARRVWIEDYARRGGFDLAASYAYADSMTDLPLLEAVGNPVAVNPEVGLFREARARGWPVEEWEPDPGVPRLLLPEAAL